MAIKLFVAFLICLMCSLPLFAHESAVKSNGDPTLYIVRYDPNNDRVTIFDSHIFVKQHDANQIPPNLVIVTHGWLETVLWFENMTVDLAKILDPNDWLCGFYDWREKSLYINPTDAATYARDQAWRDLSNSIKKLSPKFEHIHMIGHSAGSWLINQTARNLSQNHCGCFHLTFLDAYVPPLWDEAELGNINDPNSICWSDHYFNFDITLGLTSVVLTNAHNVNITAIEPGINDHRFPRYWYHATALGKYTESTGYAKNKLHYKTDKTIYGFPRSLEAGIENFSKSRKLPVGNDPIKLKKSAGLTSFFNKK